ncbi:Uncharacterized protein dnm_097250 [Desulfonema magnum]|uniref:Uncharacterized protein n=1 Tax=Desulfonema magnum TaxID=45655 RepID=A0A975BXH7_9BACT|nr:Uncharacterized protein dnm_097250 [Desulfonema magnum]
MWYRIEKIVYVHLEMPGTQNTRAELRSRTESKIMKGNIGLCQKNILNARYIIL